MSNYYPEPPRNPALVPIKERISITGGWSERALFPSAKIRKARQPRKVFIIEQDCRRFVIVAANVIKANQRFNSIYP